MVTIVEPHWLFDESPDFPLIDVRSPSEYLQGHIPGAINIPLFSDQERAEVGTRYHDAGKDAALLLGLDFAGAKLSKYVKQLNAITNGRIRDVVLYCWRGGMRSASLAWLFSQAGYHARVIAGGYKAYRAYIRQKAGEDARFMVLGGMTGSGKTAVLHELQKLGEQIVDLEEIAHNKGSVFGYLGQTPQPTNEQFENNLFEELHKLDNSRRIWIEDESRSIGSVSLPSPLYDRIKQSPLMLLKVPYDIRVQRLAGEYAVFPKEHLLVALEKIAQPLGGRVFAEAADHIRQENFTPAIGLVLQYYDKTYEKALLKHKERPVTEIETGTGDAAGNAALLLKAVTEAVADI